MNQLSADYQQTISQLPTIVLSCYCFYSDQDNAEKWLHRGFEANGEEHWSIATQCYSYSLLYCPMDNIALLSTLYASRAETNYRTRRFVEARKDIAKCRKVDPALVKVCVTVSINYGSVLL